MKPNFALSLSFEGILLLHRSGTGWSKVGDVALDSPDLAGELAVLRKTALALDPAGLRSKIILPNDQVRYLALDTTRASADDVRATLEGATPYKVADLAWDFVKGGGRTYIAAVARETLDEAENFAAEHRFGPVSFTAIPEEFAFVGEPFFGMTRAAAKLLPAGETVERDPVPVRMPPPARSSRPVPRPEPAADTASVLPEQTSPVAETVAAAPDAPPAPEVSSATPDTPPPAETPAETPTVPDAPPVTEATPTPDAPPAPVAEVPAETVDTPAPPEAPPAVDAAPLPPVADVPAPTALSPAVAVDLPPAATETETPPAEPAATDTTPPEAAPPDPVPPAAPPEEPEQPVPVFASRSRSQRTLVADPATRPGSATPPAPASAAPAPGASDRAEPVFSRRTPPPLAPTAPPATEALQPVAEKPAPTPPVVPPPDPVAARLSIDSVATPAPRTTTDTTAPRITGVSVAAAGATAPRPTVVPFAAPRTTPVPAAPTPAPDAGARIAPFPPRVKPPGAETPKRAAPPPAATAPRRPRFLGLILTAILIVVMLIAALWLGRTDNVVSRLFGRESDTAVAAAVPVAVPLVLPEPEAPATDVAPATAAPEPDPLPETDAADAGELVPADTAPVAATDTALPDAVAAAAAAAFVADAIAGLDAPAATEPAQTTAAPTGTVVSSEEADRFYAATGVWLRAPRLPLEPETEDLTALSLATMDAPPADRAGAALPANAPDAGLVAQLNPPPAGTRLPRDDRGFILATPEGTVSPSGTIIFAGSPPVLPLNRPGTVAPEPPPEAATAEATALPDQPLSAPPSVRPQARTATFIASLPPEATAGTAPDATGATPDAALDPTTPPADVASAGAVTLAGLRPPARPGSIAALAPEPLPAFDGPSPVLRPAGLAPEGATSTPDDALPPEAEDAAPVDPEAALAQTLASIVEGAGDPLATATPLAVAAARRPDSRPSNFARVVQQQTERLARATAAAQQPTAQQQTAPASLGTPEESAETEAEDVAVAAAAPSGDVPRSVSDAATMENAMSLREINLIGVYGTPNDRRALVRLENGRYVRVSVGDSLDGGQVSAISDSALNYVRRGRTVTLEIPEG
jgi:type IV pilus biogenesis protein PilP